MTPREKIRGFFFCLTAVLAIVLASVWNKPPQISPEDQQKIEEIVAEAISIKTEAEATKVRLQEIESHLKWYQQQEEVLYKDVKVLMGFFSKIVATTEERETAKTLGDALHQLDILLEHRKLPKEVTP